MNFPHTARLSMCAREIFPSKAGIFSRRQLGKMADFPVSVDNLQPEVTAKVNGSEVRFVLDSGAFYSMIDGASAARLHLRTYPAPAGFYVTGIGGSIRVALTRIDELSLNGVPLRNVEFIVGGNELGGGRIGVLGRNFLQLADTEYDFARGVARLLVPKDCGDAQVAYWLHAGDGYSVIGIARPDDSLLLGTRLSKAASFRQPIMSYAYVNGVEMRVMFDTGAGTSILSLKAAARAGIKLDSPGVTPAGFGWGIGRSTVANYLAPVSSFKIGDEEIRNTKLRLGDEEIKGVDMLIGADFFLSHHFYVANSQKKIYFSYNGVRSSTSSRYWPGRRHLQAPWRPRRRLPGNPTRVRPCLLRNPTRIRPRLPSPAARRSTWLRRNRHPPMNRPRMQLTRPTPRAAGRRLPPDGSSIKRWPH